ncbi:ABC transporter permease [Candidatus Roizmanbacteria bacterium]|nr:ABC transporter permease [Candidatus Roizmanbacteria bacterium]
MKNYFTFIIKSAFFDFSRNKGRTFLTSLGILIGVMSVVLLIAFGLGLKKYINNQFESLGSNLLRVLPGKILQNGSFRGGSSGTLNNIRFDEKDIITLQRLKSVEIVVPVYTRSVTVSVGKGSEIGDLYAANEGVFTALNAKPQYGELFTKSDVEKRSKIVVLGPKIAIKLFGEESQALGKNVKVEGQSFRVIGVLESKGGGGFGGPDLDSFVYMPFRTAYVFNTDKKIFAIIVKAKTDVSLDQAKIDIKTMLLKRYKEDDFSVIDQAELLGAISSIFAILNTILVAIAAISLIVGGIGIMNIMFVTVTERIKEIGIRRALGARKNDILHQFLIEAIILALLGGFLGLSLAYIIVSLIQGLFPAYIDAQSVVLALGVSSLIGIIFGVFPAKKAADLSPIDAIRYE